MKRSRSNASSTSGPNLPDERYPEQEQRTIFYREALDRIRGVPGIESAALVYNLPLDNESSWSHIAIEGQAPRAPGEEILAGSQVISPEPAADPHTSNRMYSCCCVSGGPPDQK